MIKRLIIAGMGPFGECLIHYLQTYYEIIAIDPLLDRVEQVRNTYDIQGILDNILDPNLLSTLDLDETCGFLSLTETDSVNLAACQYVNQWFSPGFVAALLQDLEVYTLAQTALLRKEFICSLILNIMG